MSFVCRLKINHERDVQCALFLLGLLVRMRTPLCHPLPYELPLVLYILLTCLCIITFLMSRQLSSCTYTIIGLIEHMFHSCLIFLPVLALYLPVSYASIMTCPTVTCPILVSPVPHHLSKPVCAA
jgi:hypothetical protein